MRGLNKSERKLTCHLENMSEYCDIYYFTFLCGSLGVVIKAIIDKAIIHDIIYIYFLDSL